ncbi:MAG: hypothetical protein QF787_13265, partial [Nitrospinota bacterium]|nr:hypothetical protein [Nitrospinota bacterium]
RLFVGAGAFFASKNLWPIGIRSSPNLRENAISFLTTSPALPKEVANAHPAVQMPSPSPLIDLFSTLYQGVLKQ